ncbi:MAG: amidohydrolase family protein [Acidobacteriaceae bacterium]|nr:amidohydrolase family protein [Acidobacteriaceae bacterium]
MVVMPGFVDPNLRLTLDKGSRGSGRPAKRRKLADFYSESLSLLRSCQQHGTLNAAIKAGTDSNDWRSDISVIRRLAEVGDNPVRVLRVWRLSWPSDLLQSDATFGDFADTLHYLVSRKLIQFLEFEADGQHCPPDRLWISIQETGLGISLLWPGGPSGLLADLLARTRPINVCLPFSLSPAECALVSNTSGAAIFSVGKEVLEESATNSVRQLARDGAAITLSSGYDSTGNPTFSMQMVIALAVLRLGLSPEEAISASTINAAHAVGLGHSIGSLEAGKRADVLVLNVPDYRELPGRFGINHAGMVIRDGNIVFNRTRWKVTAS